MINDTKIDIHRRSMLEGSGRKHNGADHERNKEECGLFASELRLTKWMSDGNCADSHPSVFFPRDGTGVIAAQQICADCPVAADCLEYALTNHISHGVWGGTSERQRRRILSTRRRARRSLLETRSAA